MSRRQRRAQQAQSQSHETIKTADDIPHIRPSESVNNQQKPAKTLLELAAEKQADLQPRSSKFEFDPKSEKNVVNVKIDEQGNIVSGTKPEDASSADLPPWIDTLFLAISLSMLHFTLEVLTVHQYAQTLKFLPIFSHTIFRAFPTLTILIHFFHGHLISLPTSSASLSESPGNLRRFLLLLRQTLYLAIANAAGCYLIYLTNDKGYYAVMKNAPSVGTLWIWSVLEMGIFGAVGGVLGPGLYAWYYGYGIY
jgi:hypothetical protein